MDSIHDFRGIETAGIFGTGGFAKEVIDYIERDGHYNITHAFSTQAFKPFGKPYDKMVCQPEHSCHFKSMPFFMGVADPALKEKFFFDNRNLSWRKFIDKSVQLSEYADVGKGCIITPFCMLAGDCILGDFVTMNMYSCVTHDCRISAFTSIMPKVEICGGCTLGERCYIGTGAILLPGVTLAEGVKVSAGAVVRKSVLTPGVTVYGDPAQVRPGVRTGEPDLRDPARV